MGRQTLQKIDNFVAIISKGMCFIEGGHNWSKWEEPIASKYENSPYDQFLERHCIHCNKLETKDKIDHGE